MNDKKLVVVFSQFIRLRDSDQNGYCRCFTCPVVRYWSDMDCGHGHGRQHLGTKYNEQNNHAQCKGCNAFHGGRREIYKAEVDKRYGPGTWDQMEILARKPLKLGQFEVDIFVKHYAKEVARLKQAKGLK